jgi:hypothetical protein
MNAGDQTGVNVARLFTAAVLLPVQVVHPPPDRWLRRLCLAILEDALGCLEGQRVPRARRSAIQGARRARAAWEWVLSDADYCLSFPTVCAVLNLDAEAVRRQVRHCLAQGRAA